MVENKNFSTSTRQTKASIKQLAPLHTVPECDISCSGLCVGQVKVDLRLDKAGGKDVAKMSKDTVLVVVSPR